MYLIKAGLFVEKAFEMIGLFASFSCMMDTQLLTLMVPLAGFATAYMVPDTKASTVSLRNKGAADPLNGIGGASRPTTPQVKAVLPPVLAE